MVTTGVEVLRSEAETGIGTGTGTETESEAEAEAESDGRFRDRVSGRVRSLSNGSFWLRSMVTPGLESRRMTCQGVVLD